MRIFNPDLKIFTTESLPPAYEHQIRSFYRMEWWDSYQTDINPPLGKPEYQPLNFVLVEADCLYGALQVTRTTIQHRGETYQCYGLGGVFTYPAFRKRGFGAWMVRDATTYIQNQADADIAVLWTQDHNVAFYVRNGWEHTPHINMMIGDPIKPYQSVENVLMVFLSERAKLNRPQFEAHPVYFGKRAW